MTTEETPLLQNSHDAVYDRFPSGRKKVLVFIVSLGALVTFFTSGTFIPTIPQIVEELDSTKEVIRPYQRRSYAVGVYMLANAVGSLVAARYSSFYGRRPIYLWWFPVMIIGSIGVANAQSVMSLMVWRFIQAAGSSPGLSVGAGVIGDIYKLEERGTALGIYLCTSLLGYALAPTIGGVMAYYWSWRAIHVSIAAFCCAVLVSIVFFFPETIHPGTKGLDRCERSGRVPSKVWPVMLNPLEQLALLRSPNILVAAFLNYTGMLTDFALLVPLPYTIVRITRVPRTYQPLITLQPPHSRVNATELRTKRCWERAFSLLDWAKQVNVLFLHKQGAPITHIDPVGAPLAGWISDKVVVKYKKKRGYWYPEDRLRASMFSCYLPLCVLGSALITKYVPGRLGLTLNLICLFLNGVGCDIALTPYGTYVVDILHSKSAEVTAAVNTFRMIAVAGSTAVMLPMIDAYGYLFTSFVVAMVATAGLGLTIVMIAHGEAMRRWMDVGFSTAENN
ncbi:hypothetical protein D9756_008851 [Leucocoprinus leucothites]|uniref:Major facilitator superfamily (MFS) profile domain-containing protein n=1 Tax=Leucocoprinus leucothites TaxID=201217 RepID=A0A8H5FUZ1_9AGAR|nr:hypothetical protein D9756_008851 [Leucoagaricus leucothites]